MKAARTFWLLLAVTASCLLCGCIPVDNLGGYWDTGGVDPQLLGHWKYAGSARLPDQGDTFISFQREGDHYIAEILLTSTPAYAPRTTQQVKTLVLGKHEFLMSGHVRAPSYLAAMAIAYPQGLLRYSVSGSVLSLYYLNETVLRDAIAQGKIAGRLPPPGVDFFSAPEQAASMVPAIEKLDARSAAFIEGLAGQPDFWKRVEHFRRVRDVEKEMRAARAYRATPKAAANTSVTVNLPDLKHFAEGRTDLLLRQLAASPEWLVTRDGSDLVAFRRELDRGTWQVDPYTGFQQTDPGRVTRCMFRFAEQAAGQFGDAFNRPLLKVVGPMAGSVHLNLAAGAPKGIQSYLAAGQKGLWFEFYEQTPQESRVRTREALRSIAGLLRTVRQSEAEVQRLGYVTSLMPPQSYRKGTPDLEVSSIEPAGSYDVVAWANPGREGSVSLKVFDAGSGAELTPPLTFIGPSEFMGWSDDPKTLFRYDSMVAFRGAHEGRHFQARIELWLRPADGGPEAKLAQKTYPVEAPPRPAPQTLR